LYYIKDTLGFGSVIKQSVKQNTHRFIIQDYKNIYLICLLFNGNMVFPTKNGRFLTFLSKFNEKIIKNKQKIIIPIMNTITPTLNDA
jgi:hypothetical protein